MKLLLINIKNLIPYLVLIFLYFIFVNIEARQDLTNHKTNNKNKLSIDNQSNIDNNILRISIPVIPYSQ